MKPDGSRISERNTQSSKRKYYSTIRDNGNFTLYTEIAVKACSLCGTVVKLNQNVMTQRYSDNLAGFPRKGPNICVAGCPHICFNLLLRQVQVCGNVILAAMIAIIFNGYHTQVAPQQRCD